MKNELNLAIWILNLNRDKEKRHFMQSQMDPLGVQYEFIEAIDGRSLAEKDMKPYSKAVALRDFGRELTLGEIGCALSHIKMWEKILTEGIEEVLILEDDVHVGHALFDVIACRHKLPPDYEHINFSTNAHQVPFGDFITDIYRASRHAERPYSAFAYLIKKNAVRKLLDLVDPLYMPIDNFISIMDIVSYGVYPKAVVLAEMESSIGRRWDNMPEPGYWLKKFREFKEILKAIAIFIGFSPKTLIKIHLFINHFFGKRSHR